VILLLVGEKRTASPYALHAPSTEKQKTRKRGKERQARVRAAKDATEDALSSN